MMGHIIRIVTTIYGSYLIHMDLICTSEFWYTKMLFIGSILSRDNYFESMTGRYGRRRRDLAAENDEIDEKSFSGKIDIPEMEMLERSIRDIENNLIKQLYKDYVPPEKEVRIIGGEKSARGVS